MAVELIFDKNFTAHPGRRRRGGGMRGVWGHSHSHSSDLSEDVSCEEEEDDSGGGQSATYAGMTAQAVQI